MSHKIPAAAEPLLHQREPAKSFAVHTGHRKQSSLSFPGCFCSYSVYCDGHITTFVLTEWCCCASQVPIHVFSFLQRLTTGCCQRPQWGRGWHRAISFHTACFSENHISGRKWIYLSLWESSGREWKGENCLFCKKMSKNCSEPHLLWAEVAIISNIINRAVHAHELLMISNKQSEIKFGRERKHKEKNLLF